MCFNLNSIAVPEGAFTPDGNEALCTNYLHVMSMQKRNRQSCGVIRANEANANWAFGAFDLRFAQVELWRILTNQELALAVTWLQAEAENLNLQWMNEWMMHLYSAFCVLWYTQSALQSCGGSLLNHHQCAASTWMMRRLPQDNGASALTTHQLQMERER